MSSNPRRIGRRPHIDPVRAAAGDLLEVEFIDFSQISENWNAWDLEDGTRIRIKAALNEAYIPLDPETGERMRGEEGVLKYGFGMAFSVNVQPSESAHLIEEDEEE